MVQWRIERVLRRTGMRPTRFGREAVGDPNFVFDLREGREPRARTLARVIRYIESLERGLGDKAGPD